MSENHKSSRLHELEIEQKELDVVKTKSEIQKIEIEKEKINLESIELRKMFLNKPQWWAFFTTFIVSLITLISLWANGTFDLTRAKTERDLIVLQKEKTEFEIKQKENVQFFESQTKIMDSIIKEKEDSISAYTTDISKLKTTNQSLIDEKLALQKENKDLTIDIHNLKDSVNEKQKIVTSFVDTVSNLNKTIKMKDIESKMRSDDNRTSIALTMKNIRSSYEGQLTTLKIDLAKCREDLLNCQKKQ